MTVDRERGLYLLKEMIRIRRLEEKSAQLYSAMKIRGFLHLYNGEEAVGVGVLQALTPDDNLEKYNSGIEYVFKDFVSLRAGGRFNYDSDGFTAGGG